MSGSPTLDVGGLIAGSVLRYEEMRHDKEPVRALSPDRRVQDSESCVLLGGGGVHIGVALACLPGIEGGSGITGNPTLDVGGLDHHEAGAEMHQSPNIKN